MYNQIINRHNNNFPFQATRKEQLEWVRQHPIKGSGNMGNPFISFTGGLVFSNDFSSSTGWTTYGSGVSVTGGTGRARTAAIDSGIYANIGGTLSDTLWVWEWDDIRTNTGTGALVYCLAAGTSVPATSSQDFLGIYQNNSNYYNAYKDGGAAFDTGIGPAFSEGTHYWDRLIRTSATNLRLLIFSNSGRTSQVGSTANTTIASTIGGLTHIHFSTQGITPDDFDVDNVSIRDNSDTI